MTRAKETDGVQFDYRALLARARRRAAARRRLAAAEPDAAPGRRRNAGPLPGDVPAGATPCSTRWRAGRRWPAGAAARRSRCSADACGAVSLPRAPVCASCRVRHPDGSSAPRAASVDLDRATGSASGAGHEMLQVRRDVAHRLSARCTQALGIERAGVSGMRDGLGELAVDAEPRPRRAEAGHGFELGGRPGWRVRRALAMWANSPLNGATVSSPAGRCQARPKRAKFLQARRPAQASSRRRTLPPWKVSRRRASLREAETDRIGNGRRRARAARRADAPASATARRPAGRFRHQRHLDRRFCARPFASALEATGCSGPKRRHEHRRRRNAPRRSAHGSRSARWADSSPVVGELPVAVAHRRSSVKPLTISISSRLPR